MRELLELLAATKPLVLILDDLHWADSGSIELIGALLRRPPSAPVLLAMAVRPRQSPERLAGAFERAHRAGRLTRLELSAFSLEEARELLGGGVDAAALYEESGGNPFYLEQLARSLELGAAPLAASTSVGGVEVPPAVAAALAEELALLSGEARRMLEGAAVAGDPFEPELMAAAAGVDTAAAVEALDELLRRDLVRPTDVPRRFRFRHPLVRRAVYEASPGGWRLGAHQRSAEALAARGAAAAARAHHLERSATQGDRDAVAVLREAGEEAAQRTPAGAARWFAAALRLLGDSAPAEERVELLTALAGAEAATGHFAEARAALLAGDRAAAGRSRRAGRSDGGVRRSRAAARSPRGGARPPRERAREARRAPARLWRAGLMITLAMDAFYRQQHHDTRAWGERALDVATELGDRPLTAAALAAVGLACAFTEAIADAELHCSRAAELIEAMPDPELAIRLDAIAYLTGAEVYLDRFEEATAHGRRGVSLARATGQGELLPMLTQALGVAFFARGLLGEAAELLDATTEAARLSGNRQLLAWNLLNRAFVAANQGEVETALAAAEESVELTRDLDESHISMYAGVILAIARMESGNPEQAAELFVAAAGGEALPRMPGGWRAKYLELLTRCRIALGRIDEAERSAGFASAVATDDRPRHEHRLGRAGCGGGCARPRRHGHGRRARTRVGRRRGGGRGDARCRGLAPPGRPRARAGRGARPRRRATGAGGGRARRLRRRSLPAGGRARAAQARARRPPPHASGQGRRHRGRDAHRTGAPARPARRRSQDEPRDRRRAVPQPEDGRDAPAEHVPQARRLVTRRARARGRAGRARSAGVGRNLLRPHEVAGRARLAVLVADDQQRALDGDVAALRVRRRAREQRLVVEGLERLAELLAVGRAGDLDALRDRLDERVAEQRIRVDDRGARRSCFSYLRKNAFTSSRGSSP